MTAAVTTRPGSGAKPPRASTGSRRRPRSSTTANRRSTAGSPTAPSTPATTRSTGTSTRGRGDQAALHLRQPGHRHRAQLHVRGAARPGRPVRRRAAPRSASRRATASSSTCRWCPRPSSRCSPARGSAPSTRSCSAGSPRAELAARIDDAAAEGDRVGARAASSRAGSSPYKPLLDEAIERSAHKPDKCVILQRAAGPARPRRRSRRRLGRR